MQTFITDFDMTQNARNLDDKRLGKQRVEALQIADCFLVKESRWKNHPAVRMWAYNTGFLVMDYIPFIMQEWEIRGFKNIRCGKWYDKIYNAVFEHYDKQNMFVISSFPWWLDMEFIEAHRSNLIRKKPEHYRPLFPDTKEGLEYIWPVK